jgi:hypothetical protein
MAKQTFTTGQVLLASQLTSLQQTAMLGGAASNKTSSYTLVAADAGSAISMTSTSATTITVNTGLFAAGDTVHITNLGSGVATITAGTATVNSSATLALAQYESGFLDFTSTSAAIFVKGAGAAAGGAGDLIQIATGNLSGTSVTLSGLSSYSELLLLMTGITTTTSGTTYGVRVNNNSGTNYRLLGAVGVNGIEQLFSNPTGDSFYHERDTNNGTGNSIVIKFTNTKSTGFTDADYYGFVNGNNGQPYNTVYRGVYGVSEAVSSLVIMNYSGYSFNAGTYRLFGA